jgi:hypothetical protein
MRHLQGYDAVEVRPPGRHILVSAGGVAVVRLASSDTVQATVSIQNPPYSTMADPRSICRHLLQHLVGIIRLCLLLCLFSTNTAIKFGCRRTRPILGGLDSATGRLPYWAGVWISCLKRRMQNLWPSLWSLINQSLLLPIQSLQARIEAYEQAQQVPAFTGLSPEKVSSDGESDYIITINHLGGPIRVQPLRLPQQNSFSNPQTLPRLGPDDIPTLEEPTSPVSTHERPVIDLQSTSLHESTMRHPQRVLSAGLPQDLSNDLKCRNAAEHNSIVSELSNKGFSIATRVRSPWRIELPQSSARGTSKTTSGPAGSPVQSDHQAHQKDSCVRTRESEMVPPSARKSSLSSDILHAESFSPERLIPSFHFSEEGLTQLKSLLASSPQTNNLEYSPTAVCPDPLHGEQSPDVDAYYTDKPPQTAPVRTERPHSTQHRPPALRSPLPSKSSQHYETDYCPSDTTSFNDHPSPTSSGPHHQRNPSEDQYAESCVSCETCDRRHQRACRSSRIPRRVKTFEHCRPRTGSLGSCYSGKSAASVGTGGTVVRRKLGKRKVKVY